MLRELSGRLGSLGSRTVHPPRLDRLHCSGGTRIRVQYDTHAAPRSYGCAHPAGLNWGVMILALRLDLSMTPAAGSGLCTVRRRWHGTSGVLSGGASLLPSVNCSACTSLGDGV